jgi:hypothetical protein
VFETLTKEEQGYYQRLEEMGCVSSDVLTKNLPQDIFERHVKLFCGEDQYMKKKTKVSNLQVD